MKQRSARVDGSLSARCGVGSHTPKAMCADGAGVVVSKRASVIRAIDSGLWLGGGRKGPVPIRVLSGSDTVR